MGNLLELILTPAIVSLLVSTWVGRVMEARRARRDHITKLFEQSREDVRRAIEAAVDYFATRPSSRTPLQEAKVVASDRELRAGITMMLSRAKSDESASEWADASQSFENFVAELTSGNFQSQQGEVDRAHLLKVVHAGASLRSSLARLRDRQLADAADRDPILRAGRSTIDYMKADGFPRS